jgi:hypothetical protein
MPSPKFATIRQTAREHAQIYTVRIWEKLRSQFGPAHFGNSDEEATHWLVVDGDTGEAYAAPKADALRAVIGQELPE